MDDNNANTRRHGRLSCLLGGVFHGNFDIDKIRIALLLFVRGNQFFALIGSLLLRSGSVFWKNYHKAPIHQRLVCPANMVENFLQHKPAGLDGGPFRVKRGEARGDQIFVDKDGQSVSLGKNSSAKVVLPAPFGPAMIRILFLPIRIISGPRGLCRPLPRCQGFARQSLG